jgi:hypothetical protein
MLILKPFSNDHGRLMLQGKPLAPLTFITRVGFSAITLAYVLDSLVRVSRRDSKRLFDKIAEAPRPQPRQPCLRLVAASQAGFDAIGPTLPTRGRHPRERIVTTWPF